MISPEKREVVKTAEWRTTRRSSDNTSKTCLGPGSSDSVMIGGNAEKIRMWKTKVRSLLKTYVHAEM